MLDAALVRDHLADVDARLRTRGMDPSRELSELASLDAERRRLIPLVETLKREQNTAGEAVARAKKAGQDASEIFAANKARAAEIKTHEVELDAIETRRDALMLTLPNVPHESVPVGTSAADNPEVRRWGTPRTFDFEPKPHWDLGVDLGILDFERATRMSGARFSILSGAGARLARGLINFMLDLHTREHGYREVEPPFLVNRKALTGTGNLPKFEPDLFRIAGDWDLFLIPTAEVPLTNLPR
jgi:seryl-tRNA synthetase